MSDEPAQPTARAGETFVVPAGKFYSGPVDAMPGPHDGYSQEQVRFLEAVEWAVAVEARIWRNCHAFVREWVNERLRTDPRDTAEIGNAMLGPGQRTPLELAEPYIAIEFYRSVRDTILRSEAPARGPLRRLWDRVMGRSDAIAQERPAARARPAAPEGLRDLPG